MDEAKPDWAETEAKRLVSEDGCYVTKLVDRLPLESYLSWEEVAEALRRVARQSKAEGMREAAQIAVSDLGEGDIDFIAFKLRLEADKIENAAD